eukprot:12398981-Karenia_brevis.AAC.1
MPNNIILTVANVYGWTNGHYDESAASRTDNLLHAILEDFKQQPSGPKLIVGDLNAETSDYPSSASVLDNGEYVDLGAHDCFEGPTLQPTCFPYNHNTPTRRDY